MVDDEEKTPETSGLTEEEWSALRWKMDLTDAQLEEVKKCAVVWPKTIEAIKTFGEALKSFGVSDEQLVKISRALGPVLETLAKESGDRAWGVVDMVQKQLGEIIDEDKKQAEAMLAAHEEVLTTYQESQARIQEQLQDFLQRDQCTPGGAGAPNGASGGAGGSASGGAGGSAGGAGGGVGG